MFQLIICTAKNDLHQAVAYNLNYLDIYSHLTQIVANRMAFIGEF